jgi:U3 small nucleolar RNA-associated protein 14
VRTRGLEEHDGGGPRSHKKRQLDQEEDEDGFGDSDGEDGAAPPRNKRARRDDGGDGFDGFSDDDGGDAEGGSESDEWHVGVAGEDEDSELDSDEAFGESDEERFEGFAFSGSRSGSKKKRAAEEEDEGEGEEEEDLESLGSDAIDLATALDQFSEEDGEQQGEGSGSGSEEEDEESTDGDDESEEDEEDEDDPSKLGALQSMIAGFAGEDEKDEEGQDSAQNQNKLTLKDLGLFGVKDEHIKRSIRLMNKEDKAVKPGSSKKLDVPLAKRQQDRLLRSAAYEKTNETLDRWIETVKHNRRADHLIFPLAQNAHDRGLNSGELMPITQKTSGTELEQTILAIMEESGLGPSAKPKKEEGEGDKQPGLSQAEQKEILRQRRLERERHSREMARAKRIKKIKSKAYRRIHRKELLRQEQAEHEQLAEAGLLDSDEEREAQERRRAMERMGTRHRESKWAKLGKKAGRAVWDEDFRAGLTDMARRKEELRRRIEGRKDGSDDEDNGSEVSDGSDEDDRRRLLAELDRAAAYEDEGEPRSKLMQMKFMQRAEEQRKKENDELVAQIRRELDSDYDGSSDPEERDIGRRQFGMGNSAGAVKPANPTPGKKPTEPRSVLSKPSTDHAKSASQPQCVPDTETGPSAPGAAGAWSSVGPDGRKSKKTAKSTNVELDFSKEAMAMAKTSKPKTKSEPAEKGSTDNAHDSDDEDAMHLPLAIRDLELLNRAFAGDDVAAQFEEEKAEIEREDDEKEIDNTLPGWGGWVGEGVSNREKKRHQGRFVTKVEGVKKKDRQDFRLKGVIVSEKRVRKVCLLPR